MLNILAHISFFGMFAWFIWPIALLVVTLATPKSLLNKYLKEPHFNMGELVAYNSFPTFFIRTSIFCRLYLTPKAVKGRNLYGFVEDSPKWYRTAVLVTTLGAISHGAAVFMSGGIYYFFA